MVLQRDSSVPIWGWAAPGEKVSVSFAGKDAKVTADAAGRWEVRFKNLKASADAGDMTISGSSRIVLTNILVGEVWLCSGQSNMEKPIGKQGGQKPTQNYEQELKTGDLYPNIRFFKAARVLAAEPAKNVKGEWSVCSSNSLEATKFSAVGYFFGREIYNSIKVPIGLVESSWGGTRIEPWTPPVGFKSVPKLASLAQPLDSGAKLSNTIATAIFNGMVAPLVPFAIRGALWYQGESNCMDQRDGFSYTDKMEALINGWRKLWGRGNFPFYYVQLAPFHYFNAPKPRVPTADALPEIWEDQSAALRIPNTGMAVITDLVDDLKDIHPTRKLEVGQRLALIALARDYGKKGTVYSGPIFKSMKLKEGNAVLSFNNAEGGLVAKDGQPLSWFTIAGPDGKFVPAEAQIVGETVVVSSPSVAEPKAVRFAWSESAQPNLFNKAGLPACPFRTDRER
jgi:sialate O-acetylesterase